MLLGKSRQLACFKMYWRETIVCLGLLLFGCAEPRSSQCQQIFAISQNLERTNQTENQAEQPQSRSPQAWLQAAQRFSQAAGDLRALEIKEQELRQYQQQLANIYQIYARTTADAVKARKNKDLTSLKSARQDGLEAGLRQPQLIRKLNAYCLPPE